MPSMSYCMFENTELEISQLLRAMKDAYHIDDLNLNKYEVDSFHNLAAKCEMYIKLYNSLLKE
jgi:hypothetical protein